MDLNKVPKQFCENITVGFSKEYFVMGMMTGEAAAFFAMTPQHMKRLSQYLAVQISDYEQKNGAIDAKWAPGIESPIQTKDLGKGGDTPKT